VNHAWNRLGLLVGVLAILGVAGHSAPPVAAASLAPDVFAASVAYQQDAVPNPCPTGGLTNNNHYTNVDRNVIHSPATCNDGSVPAGATARCRDGTYSFSQNRRGTCSGHGGVAQWY
jgi:hypothetical protein